MKKLGIGVIAAALLLTGCAASGNATACGLYESAYNQVADSVAGDYEPDFVQAQVALLPDRLSEAFDKASGDVAVEMQSSLEMAQVMSSSEDAGVAFFMSVESVADACSADGAAIDVHELK